MVNEIQLHIVRLQEKSNSRISKCIRKTFAKLVPSSVCTSCLAHMDTHTIVPVDRSTSLSILSECLL